MSTASAKRYYTPEEYLALEAQSLEKHEYFHGEIVAMSGVRPSHDRIADEIRRLIGNYLVDNRCEVFSSDIRVKSNAANAYTYPDASIACDAKFETISGLETLTNPVAIVEVLSESTEAIDRGRKLGRYIQIPSLREYLLVAQEELRVDHLVRTAEDNWRYIICTQPDDIIHLESIIFDLRLADVYRRVTFPSPRQEPLP